MLTYVLLGSMTWPVPRGLMRMLPLVLLVLPMMLVLLLLLQVMAMLASVLPDAAVNTSAAPLMGPTLAKAKKLSLTFCSATRKGSPSLELGAVPTLIN
jgi:hypothetical protein